MERYRTVYEDEMHKVCRDTRPNFHEGEHMNWAIINKEHGTLEAHQSSLANAIVIAKQMTAWLEQVLGDEEGGQQDLTLN